MITRSDIQLHVDQLTAFMGSVAYGSNQLSIEESIDGIKLSILSRPPVTETDRGEVLMLYGQLSQLETDLTFFVRNRDALKEQLVQMDKEQTLVATTETEEEIQNE